LLNISTKQLPPDVTVVEIRGAITLGRESKRVEWQIEDLLKADQKKVIFDLSGVTHLDSSGIGSLVMCAGMMKRSGGELRVANPAEIVEKLMTMTQIGHVLKSFPTVEEAAQDFSVADGAPSA
jgi:anti-sigma B factor antagonist